MPASLDIHSLTAVAAAVALALAGAMIAVRATQRTYPGFGLWVAGACASSAALGLISLQGRAPAALTVVAANALVTAAAALTAAGLERFFGLAPRWPLHGLGVATAGVASALLAYPFPAVTARIVLVSLLLAAWAAWSAALVVRHAPRVLGAPNRLLPIAFGASCAWNLGRAALLVGRADAANALPANDPAQALFFLAFTPIVAVVSLGLTALELQRAEHDLRASAEELTLLRGIVPICAGCKQVRDGDGWTPVEAWVGARSRAEFSHGLCPACAARLYPE